MAKKKKTAKKKVAKKTKKTAAGKKGLPTRKELIKKHKQFKREIGQKLFANSKLRAYFKHMGLRADNQLIGGLTDEIYIMLKKSALRTIKNGRKTARPWDF